jgi:anaerobic selenocysteine-containing dehydrogenase
MQVDRAARRVLRIEGDPDDPRSRGHLCPKAYALSGVYEDPDRLRRPLRRMGTDWQEIDWKEAIDFAAEKLLEVREAHGADAVGLYIGNPTGFDVGAMLTNRTLAGALATPRAFSGATMDHHPKIVTTRVLYGKNSMLSIPDIDRCDYFLCLGGNPIVSQGSLMSAPDVRGRLRAIQKRGGKLVIVDPRRTETARAADEHLFIRPGSDALFLLALVHVLFDEGLVRLGRFEAFTDGVRELGEQARSFSPEAVASFTGIASDVTRRIAREFAGTRRACCYGRIGTCTVEFGLLASWLVEVLGILTGHLDEPGGLMFPRPATGQHEPGRPSSEFEIGRWRSVARGLPEIENQLPSAALAEEIDSAGDGRLRALVTLAGNPVLSTPNGVRLAKALEQLDFMLSLDIYLNETTRHADLILPNTPQLEHENFDYLTMTTAVRNFARWSPAVFEPDDGTWPQWKVQLGLAAKLMGMTAEALDEQLLENDLARFVGKAGLPAEHVPAAAVREKLGSEPGPMRRVDLMLRAGPYGDGFDDNADGLSLAKLRAVPHAVDLGPLEPRLPDLLRSPGRRIALAHPYFLQDVPRLRAKLAAGDEGGLRLVGRRQNRNMNTWLHNLPVLAKGRERCSLLVHPDDAKRLGLVAGARARIRSRVGEVEAPVELSDDMMPGVVSLPHGFGHTETGTRLGIATSQQPGVNSNVLTDEEALDPWSNTSIVNGIPVEVTRS